MPPRVKSNGERYVIFNVSLLPGEKERFREQCEKEGVTMNEVLAKYIRRKTRGER